MKTKRFLIDCDGPLANFTRRYLDAFTAETGMSVTVSEVNRRDMHECEFFKDACVRFNIDPRELKQRMNAHVNEPGFCSSIEVQPRAQMFVEELKKLGEVFIVTSPWDSNPTWEYERKKWLARHFGIHRHNVLQTGSKHIVRGDLFVDDRLSHVDAWAQEWPDAHAVLFDLASNKHEQLVFGNTSRGGWDHVLAIASDEHTASESTSRRYS